MINYKKSPSVRELQEVEFNKRKRLTKREVLGCKPGSWLRIMWLDAPDSVVLLMKKVTNVPGDMNLMCWVPESSVWNLSIIHTQVHSVLGHISVPEITEKPTEIAQD